jgi:hypothetical protein
MLDVQPPSDHDSQAGNSRLIKTGNSNQGSTIRSWRLEARLLNNEELPMLEFKKKLEV